MLQYLSKAPFTTSNFGPSNTHIPNNSLFQLTGQTLAGSSRPTFNNPRPNAMWYLKDKDISHHKSPAEDLAAVKEQENRIMLQMMGVRVPSSVPSHYVISHRISYLDTYSVNCISFYQRTPRDPPKTKSTGRI